MVVCDLGANVSPRRKDSAVHFDVGCRHRTAVARHIDINSNVWLSAPGMVGFRDPANVGIRQVPMCAVNEVPHSTRIDKENVACATAAFSICPRSVPSQEP